MKIYTLNKSHQGYDMDTWGHWLESSIKSYYLTEELALQAIVELVKVIPYKDNLIWDAKLGDTRNIFNYTDQLNGVGPLKQVNLYFIEVIDVITQ